VLNDYLGFAEKPILLEMINESSLKTNNIKKVSFG